MPRRNAGRLRIVSTSATTVACRRPLVSSASSPKSDPPGSVVTLIRVALLRGAAERAGIYEISQKAVSIRFKLMDFDMAQVSSLYGKPEFKGRIKIEAGTEPMISLKIKSSDVLREASELVRAYGEASVKKEGKI